MGRCRTKPKKRAPPKSTPPPKQKPLLELVMAHPLVALISLVATLCGLAVGALTLLPRVIVSPPSPQVDSNNVLSVSFDVSNAGYIPLNDVDLGFAPVLMDGPGMPGITGQLKPDGTPDFTYSIYLPGSRGHHLGLDERITFDLASLVRVNGTINRADIGIVISYLPWRIPIHRRKVFRFVTVKDYKGRINWRSWPLDELAPTQ